MKMLRSPRLQQRRRVDSLSFSKNLMRWPDGYHAYCTEALHAHRGNTYCITKCEGSYDFGRFVEVWRASKILAPEILDPYLSHTVSYQDRAAFFRSASAICAASVTRSKLIGLSQHVP